MTLDPISPDQYRSPWGQALNFDGPDSDEVVRFFTENALYWLRDFHIDALRLDAIHGIVDRNAQPFLQLLAAGGARVRPTSGPEDLPDRGKRPQRRALHPARGIGRIRVGRPME